MRTTVTFDPDVSLHLKKLVQERKVPLKRVLNETLRAGFKTLPKKPGLRFRVEPHAFGFHPGIDTTKLSKLLDEMDAERYLQSEARIVRASREGKKR